MTRPLFTNPADKEWSQPETQDLIKRWNDGESYGTICQAFGRTRSCIAGKVKRLREKGVTMRSRVSDVAQEAARRMRKRPYAVKPSKTQNAAPEASVGFVAASAPKPPRVMLPVPETIETLNIALTNMLRRHCHWPLDKDESGEMRYCGNPADGRRSYCAHHAARMYARAG